MAVIDKYDDATNYTLWSHLDNTNVTTTTDNSFSTRRVYLCGGEGHHWRWCVVLPAQSVAAVTVRVLVQILLVILLSPKILYNIYKQTLNLRRLYITHNIVCSVGGGGRSLLREEVASRRYLCDDGGVRIFLPLNLLFHTLCYVYIYCMCARTYVCICMYECMYERKKERVHMYVSSC